MSIKDIFSEFYSEMIEPYIFTRTDFGSFGRKSISIAAFLPLIIGLAIGLAVARLFEFGALGYIICGLIFTYIGGVVKSNGIDGYPLIQSLRMNAILMILIGLIVMTAYALKQ